MFFPTPDRLHEGNDCAKVFHLTRASTVCGHVFLYMGHENITTQLMCGCSSHNEHCHCLLADTCLLKVKQYDRLVSENYVM